MVHLCTIKLSSWTENVLKMYINVQKTADFVLKMAENVLKMYINVHKWQFIGVNGNLLA